MSSQPAAVPLTPSDSVLLACERFAPAPGPWAKRKLMNRMAVVGAVAAVVLAAAVAILAAFFLAGPVVGILSILLIMILSWLWPKAARTNLKGLWRRVGASQERSDGAVNPFQGGPAVLEKPLAIALISSALLANESAGVTQFAVTDGVLQAIPTGRGKPWPSASLEDRLRRNRQLSVIEVVEDWLESSSETPYLRAVELAVQGMVTRGLAVTSESGKNPGAVLPATTAWAATAIDGSTAMNLLDTCRAERPQLWQALQESLAEAFRKRSIQPNFIGYAAGVNFSTEVVSSRDAPFGFKLVNERTVRYAFETDPEPVGLLEAHPVAVDPASHRPGEYARQRATASKLPRGILRLIDRLKSLLSPTPAEVQAAIQSRLQALESAAPDRDAPAGASPSIPMGQKANIPTRLFEAVELPAPPAAHRELLDRSGRDWALVLGTDSKSRRPTVGRWWRRRRARARLLKRVPKPLRLVMLRVFGSPSYDDLVELIQPWRRVGVIQHLEGFDTIGTRPEAIAAVKAGRLEEILIETGEQVERKLSALSLKPDREFLFERHSFQCTGGTWRLAVSRMMDNADAVLMDLSSLSPTNQGCAWEIGQLLDRVPLSRVTLLVNDSTDLQCLQDLLDTAARRVAADSPNLEDAKPVWRLLRIGGLAARQPGESYFDWRRRLDIRLDPEILASFLMSTAEPRRAEPAGNSIAEIVR